MNSILVLALALAVQDKKPDKVWFDDAEKAGADYKIQGEYKGGGWGAQVVALGDGKFDVYLLEGGLPGDGWNQKTRLKAPATTADGKVAIANKDATWTGSIGDGKLAAKGPGADLAQLIA